MIPRLSSNDLQFWETMYSSGVPVASSRGGLGIAYLERIGSAVTFEKNQILFRYDEIAELVVEDSKADDEIVYAKSVLDRRIREIVGEDNFSPFDERYGRR